MSGFSFDEGISENLHLCGRVCICVCIESLMNEGALTCHVNAGERQTNFG